MPSWIRHAMRIAVVVTLAFGLGPRLELLQLVAWSNMTSVNLEVMPMDQAIEKAMSGQDICGICRIIQQTQNCQNEVPDESILAKIFNPLISLPPPPNGVRVTEVSFGSSYLIFDPCSIFIIEQPSPPSPPPQLVV
jgi:hypothetical protein